MAAADPIKSEPIPPERIRHYAEALSGFSGAIGGVLTGAVEIGALDIDEQEILAAAHIEGLRITGSFAIADGFLSGGELAAIALAAGVAGQNTEQYVAQLRPDGMEDRWRAESSALLEVLTRIDEAAGSSVCTSVYSLAAFRLAFEVAAIDGAISNRELAGLRQFLDVLDAATERS